MQLLLAMKLKHLHVLTLIGISFSLAACDQASRNEPNTGHQTERGVRRVPGSEDRNITSGDVGKGSPNAYKNEQVQEEPRMREHNKDQGHSGRSLDGKEKFNAEE